MNEVVITWMTREDAYNVWQDNSFIGDFEDLHSAVDFALEVGGLAGQRVVIESMGPK